MHIIFYEDDAQLIKILLHTKHQNYIKVLYSGKKILSAIQVADGNLIECSLLKLALSSVKSKKLICEYPNGIPRLWAVLFNLKIESHIFGVLDYGDFDFKSAFKIKLARKLFNRLYADEYIIYGENNPTQDLILEILNLYKSKSRISKRTDLLIKEKEIAQKPWGVYIAQPWEEIGNICNEHIQREIYNTMTEKISNVYYCQHPRQVKIKIEKEKIIYGWLDLKDKIKALGPPTLAASINSSLIYELKEMGINAIPIASRDNGQTVFPDADSALNRINDAINFVS